MVPYEPKNWWRLFFSVRGTVFPYVLFRACCVGLVTAALTAMFSYGIFFYHQKPKEFPNFVVKGLADNSHVTVEASQGHAHDDSIFPVIEFPQVPTLVHTVIGFVVGLLIVFRTNSSYDRYWEGRKLWSSILTNSRNLARTGNIYAGPANDVARLLTVYVYALKHHLRGEKELDEVQPLLSEGDYSRITAAANPPLMIVASISRWINARLVDGKLNPQIVRLMEVYLGNIVEAQSGCERILKTPIPFIYAVHIKHLLLIYLFTLPLALIPYMTWYAIPTALIIAFGLLGIEEAGLEIEDPFGTDPNDLPVDYICDTVAKDTKALASPTSKKE
jgi:putative membrane protein